MVKIAIVTPEYAPRPWETARLAERLMSFSWCAVLNTGLLRRFPTAKRSLVDRSILAWIVLADAVYLPGDNWGNSDFCLSVVRECEGNRVPVFADLDALSLWLNEKRSERSYDDPLHLSLLDP